MIKLTENKCEACSGLTPKSTPEEIAQFLKQTPGWEVVNGHHMVKKLKFKNFAEALKAANDIGALAEAEGHHPNIRFGWGYLEATLYTHEIDGLSKNDFILAAKISAVYP
jgi:4a-hydroxytetrahydrobiopterin dehydratase